MELENNLKVIKLIDNYGKLLTQKQYEMLTYYYFDNLSLSEIGDNFKVSRQAVRDCIQKSLHSLENYEEKLGFISKIDSACKSLENLVSSKEVDYNLLTKIIENLRS